MDTSDDDGSGRLGGIIGGFESEKPPSMSSGTVGVCSSVLGFFPPWVSCLLASSSASSSADFRFLVGGGLGVERSSIVFVVVIIGLSGWVVVSSCVMVVVVGGGISLLAVV